MSEKHYIKQIFELSFNKEDILIRKSPKVFYKYDNCGNRIIELLFNNSLGSYMTFQYTLMNYDNKNNLKSKIVFENVGTEEYDFGKIIESDNTVSFSNCEIFTNEKYINKYNNNGQLLEVEIHNLKNEENDDEKIRKTKLEIRRYIYKDDILIETVSNTYNFKNEIRVTIVNHFKYDNNGNQIEKIEKVEGLSYIGSKQVQYENVEKTSIYFDDDNNQVKEFKSYKDGVFNSKNLHMRDKIEYYGESDSTPFRTIEIGYENELKKFETTPREDEFYKEIREFIYEDSKYFEDSWLKMLIKGYTDSHDDWNFINWYNS